MATPLKRHVINSGRWKNRRLEVDFALPRGVFPVCFLIESEIDDIKSLSQKLYRFFFVIRLQEGGFNEKSLITLFESIPQATKQFPGMIETSTGALFFADRLLFEQAMLLWARMPMSFNAGAALIDENENWETSFPLSRLLSNFQFPLRFVLPQRTASLPDELAKIKLECEFLGGDNIELIDGHTPENVQDSFYFLLKHKKQKQNEQKEHKFFIPGCLITPDYEIFFRSMSLAGELEFISDKEQSLSIKPGEADKLYLFLPHDKAFKVEAENAKIEQGKVSGNKLHFKLTNFTKSEIHVYWKTRREG